MFQVFDPNFIPGTWAPKFNFNDACIQIQTHEDVVWIIGLAVGYKAYNITDNSSGPLQTLHFYNWILTLQGINISHLGKRKIIFKYALSGGYVNFLEGTSISVIFHGEKSHPDCFKGIHHSWPFPATGMCAVSAKSKRHRIPSCLGWEDFNVWGEPIHSPKLT